MTANSEILNFPTENGQPRNKSSLSYADCYIRLYDNNRPFEDMSDDDLDSLYFVAFNLWAYHMTREGYIRSLNIHRNKYNLKNNDN